MNKNYIYYYEKLEKSHWWWITRRKIILDLINEANIGKGSKINGGHLLEIGCGAGITLRELKNKFSIIGVEPGAR